MKLFEKIFDEESEQEVIKIFNVPVCKIYSNTYIKEVKILFGFIRVLKEYFNDKKLSITFKIPIFFKYLHFGIFFDVYKNKLKKIEYYLKKIPKQYDDVFVLNSCIGECFLFLNNFKKYIEKNKTPNYIFVALKKVHVDLIKMLCPDVPYVVIPELFYFLNEDLNEYSFKQKFHIFYEPQYFVNVENNMRQKPVETVHFLDFILKKMNFTVEEFKMQNIQVSSEEEQNVLRKAKKCGLNINNFIFVSNETTSAEKNETEFWKEIIKDFRIQGYDIFQNAVNKNNFLLGAKHFNLSLKEALILSRYAKSILMYRSGLSDVLSLNRKNMHLIYTDFKERGFFAQLSSDKVLAGFTLRKLPFINSDLIYEYDYNKYKNKKELKDIIIKNVNKGDVPDGK